MPAAAPAASSVLRSSGGHPHELAEERAERAAGRDDGPLRAERASGADRDHRRERLQQRHPRGDAALIEQHLLHRLGDAVAANGRGAVARHDTDHERSHHWNDHPPIQPHWCSAGDTNSNERRP